MCVIQWTSRYLENSALLLGTIVTISWWVWLTQRPSANVLEFIIKHFKVMVYPATHWAPICLVWTGSCIRPKMNKTQPPTSSCLDTMEDTEPRTNNIIWWFMQRWSSAEIIMRNIPAGHLTWPKQYYLEEAFPTFNVKGQEVVGEWNWDSGSGRVQAQREETTWAVTSSGC